MNLRTLPLFCALLAACASSGADLQVRVVDKPPPSELAADIREALLPKAIQVTEGDQTVYEFWLRGEVPLKSAPEEPAKALNVVVEATLIGAARVHREERDYRDDAISKGIYTLRYAFQPQDGDHSGTAAFPYFAVMIPAKSDASLQGISQYRPMVKASGRGTATGHPNVLSVRPPSGSDGESPRLTEPEAGHKAVFLKLAARAPSGAAPIELPLELVVHGHTSHP